jgi:adenylate kinase
MMVLVLLGPPGSGKGTQSARLAGYLRTVHISTGEILRQAIKDGTDLGQKVAVYMEKGQLAPSSLVIDLVAERLSGPDCQVGCLLDGFPRSVAQAEALDQQLSAQEATLDLVLSLSVPQEELERRMFERSRKEGRSDDTPAIFARRFNVYQTTTEPLISYYQEKGLLHSIDGMGSPDEVFTQVKAVVDRFWNV